MKHIIKRLYNKYLNLTQGNIKFKFLTKAEQRVEIAREALLQESKGCFFPERLVFLDFRDADKNIEPVSKVIKSYESCRCCQIGSAALSVLKLSNEDVDFAADNFFESTGAFKLLNKYFSVEQLALIEIIFEGSGYSFSKNGYMKGNKKMFELPLVVRMAAKQYTKQYQYINVRSLFVAIWQNIIDNNGTLIIPKQYYENN